MKKNVMTLAIKVYNQKGERLLFIMCFSKRKLENSFSKLGF